MSGDLGPRVVIRAVQKFTSRYSDVDILLVGDSDQILMLAPELAKSPPSVQILHAADIVLMTDAPRAVLRHKKESSMWLALTALRDERAQACVSAGNTGALLVMAKYLLGTCAGIDRPAICKSMPVESGFTYLLDLGANINCTAQQLHQFALMGAVLAGGHNQGDLARIALLNIGTESLKGTDVLQEAAVLLQGDKNLNYVGFVEANKIFSGEVDVIVCDGFHGNVALKASEGVAHFIRNKIARTLTKSIFTKLMSLLCFPLLRHIRADLDPAYYNGASFLGLSKTVIKSHGNANEKAFFQALVVAREQAIQQLPALIQQQLLSIHSQ